MGKKPSGVKAARDAAGSLRLYRKMTTRQIINNGLDVLEENMFAGQIIEKKKFPKLYLQEYGINNLYKYNLDRTTRLIYTLVADKLGIAVAILEILNHKEYEKRFGYK